MAMNKKEQAAFKELQDQVALLSALALPPMSKPKPLEPPERYDEAQHGWEYNLSRARNYGLKSGVSEVWRKWGVVYRDAELKDGRRDSRDDVYATRHDALLAMYFEVIEKNAKFLAKVRAALLECEPRVAGE